MVQKNGSNIVVHASSNGKSSLHKTQSNVEKITAMLVSQNLMGSNNVNGQSTMNNRSNCVTNIPNNKMHLRKTESSPINGILKNGGNNTTNSTVNTNGTNEHKNISFGNM